MLGHLNCLRPFAHCSPMAIPSDHKIKIWGTTCLYTYVKQKAKPKLLIKQWDLVQLKEDTTNYLCLGPGSIGVGKVLLDNCLLLTIA